MTITNMLALFADRRQDEIANMDTDDIESEGDFGVCLKELDLAQARDAMRTLHLHHRREDGSPRTVHLTTVSTLAGTLARDYYGACGLQEERYWHRVCEVGGLLHEASELAAQTFEDIIALSDLAVARVVHDLTPNRSLPRKKRIVLYANQLGRAQAPSQIVALADLLHDACWLTKLVKARQPSSVLLARLFLEQAQGFPKFVGVFKSLHLLHRCYHLRESLKSTERLLTNLFALCHDKPICPEGSCYEPQPEDDC